MKYISISMILIFALLTSIAADDRNGGNMEDKAGLTNDSDNDMNSLERLSWLAGRWQGEGFGGMIEEIWSPPSAGSMVGLFKVWKDEKVSFYEFETITSGSSGIVLKVKHFNANLTGWEEKDEFVTFPLVRAGKDEIIFEGLSYRRVSEDSIILLLDSKDKEGNIHKIELSLNRVN
jgi:hypothetical protein